MWWNQLSSGQSHPYGVVHWWGNHAVGMFVSRWILKVWHGQGKMNSSKHRDTLQHSVSDLKGPASAAWRCLRFELDFFRSIGPSWSCTTSLYNVGQPIPRLPNASNLTQLETFSIGTTKDHEKMCQASSIDTQEELGWRGALFLIRLQCNVTNKMQKM